MARNRKSLWKFSMYRWNLSLRSRFLSVRVNFVTDASRRFKSRWEADDGDEFCAVSFKPCLASRTLFATIRMLDYRANRCRVRSRDLDVSK